MDSNQSGKRKAVSMRGLVTHTQKKGGPEANMDLFPALTPMPTTILRIPAYVPETSPGIRKFHRSVIKESFPNSLGQGLVSPHAIMLAISKYLLSAWSKVSGGPPGPCLLKTDHKGQ